MLALARAFHAGTDLVLLDEPTVGLDRSAQEVLMQQLDALRQAGRCVVVTTHAKEVIQLADRVLVLDGGRLVADAAPNRLIAPQVVAAAASTAPATAKGAAQGAATASVHAIA
jgi:ABC-type multidrug transport system ATPase subunit